MDSTTSTLPEQKNNLDDRENKHSLLFSNLRLWERMLLLYQQDQQNNEHKDDANVLINNDEEEEEESTSTKNEDTSDNDAYNSSATTLYKMVGYNVPAEEVSRFATQTRNDKGWFAT